MKANVTLSRLTQLVHKQPDIAVLWLYGSRAKDTAQPDSDYDLAAAFNTFPTDAWEKRLRPELLAQQWTEQLQLPEGRISLVDINNIPLPLAISIVTQGTPLLVKDSLRLIREELRITSMWEIDYLHHRRIYG